MRTNRIAIQGIEGSFHHEVALESYGEGVQLRTCKTFNEVCESVRSNEVDQAVLAIENTLAGTILPNYNLIRQHDLRIIGEEYLRIELHLMAGRGARMRDIRKVGSHPMALHQTMGFIVDNGLEPLERPDTATAAKEVRSEGVCSAIAGMNAARHYDLDVLSENIEMDQRNYTRFLRLAKGSEPEEGDKASLRIELSHLVGSLNQVLRIFEDHYLNMSKIQSVPIIGKPYEYAFHIDVEWLSREAYLACLDEIRKRSYKLDVLGEYKKKSFNLN